MSQPEVWVPVTSPDQHNPEQEPDTPTENLNSASDAGSPESASSGWRSSTVVRTVADPVRTAALRVWDWAAPLIAAAMAWLRGGEAAGKHQAKVHPRMRAAQIGALAVAAGVLGLVVSSYGDNQPEPRGVQDAAQTAALPATPPQAPAPQAPAPSQSAKPEEKKSEEKKPEEKPKEEPKEEPKDETPAVPAKGIDVSNHNGSIDWGKVASGGQHFAFILATDGDNFSSKSFASQYSGAKNAGLLAGAYHFGRPDGSATGQAQRLLDTANYKNDGKTLPPVLDLEPDPNGSGCYGLSPQGMKGWIQAFNSKIKEGTGKDAIIYASTGFWSKCMGNSDAFKDQPLWLASYGVDNPKVPSGWGSYTFWQYTDSGSVPGIEGQVDLNKFNGNTKQLKELAK